LDGEAEQNERAKLRSAAAEGAAEKNYIKGKGPLLDSCGPLLERLILRLFANLLLRPFARQSLLYTKLGARLQIVGMTLDFLDDVFRLNFALEATQGALNGLALLQSNFSQPKSPPNPATCGYA
jgi:hypothetical protein